MLICTWHRQGYVKCDLHFCMLEGVRPCGRTSLARKLSSNAGTFMIDHFMCNLALASSVSFDSAKA